MPLSLTKRIPTGVPLTNTQHDANLTAIEGAVNTNTTDIAGLVSDVADLQNTGAATGAALNSQFQGIVGGKQTVAWANITGAPTIGGASLPFSVKKSIADQLVTGGSSAVITMDAEDFDPEGLFDLVSSTATVPVSGAGYYMLTYSAQVSLDAGVPANIAITVTLRVNGSGVDQSTMDLDATATGIRIYKGSKLVYLNDADVIDLHIAITDTGAADWKVAANPNTSITGVRLM